MSPLSFCHLFCHPTRSYKETQLLPYVTWLHWTLDLSFMVRGDRETLLLMVVVRLSLLLLLVVVVVAEELGELRGN